MRSSGDGDARARSRRRRAVAIVVLAGVTTLSGCALRQLPQERPPEPTGTHIDPIERPVGSGADNGDGDGSPAREVSV